jgi:hypothetical protein
LTQTFTRYTVLYMTTHTTPLTPSQAKLADKMADAMTQAEGYRRMLKVATEMGMEYEQNRMRTELVEWSNEADYLLESLLADGVTPEMLEG